MEDVPLLSSFPFHNLPQPSTCSWKMCRSSPLSPSTTFHNLPPAHGRCAAPLLFPLPQPSTTFHLLMEDVPLLSSFPFHNLPQPSPCSWKMCRSSPLSPSTTF